MVYLPTFTIKISQMQVNIPYMDPMGHSVGNFANLNLKCSWELVAQTLIQCSLSTDDVQLLQPIVHTTQTHVYAGWWFQSPGKILVKMGSSSQIGVKVKTYLKPPPSTGCTFVFEQDPSNCPHGYVCCCCTPTSP